MPLGELVAFGAQHPECKYAWGAADDMVLRKIAQAGLSGLSGMVNGTPADTPAPGPAPSKRGPAVASAAPPTTTGGSDIAALGYTDH